MLVDSGVKENFVDNELIPDAESLMLDYTVLDKPKKIEIAGQQLLLGIATSILPGVITDKAGTKHDVGFPTLTVPGLGRNLFSSDAATRGIKPVIETGNSRLERNVIIAPLKQHKEDVELFSFQVELGARGSAQKAPTPVMALSTQVHADLWHSRLGHMNSRIMEVLRKKRRQRSGLRGHPFRLRHLPHKQERTEGAP